MRALIIFFLFACFVAEATNVRTQTFNLHAGWNSVYLQVQPTNSKPELAFQGIPVSIAAAYVGNGSAVQYVQNPSTNTVTKDHGWLVWYAPGRPDSFLSGLFSLNANQGYLIYAQSDCVWSVTGTVILSSVQWKANSFNLAGFSLDAVSPPTFAQFFSASAAHQPYRIYRLSNNQWMQVDSPLTTQMRSGEACWIYCSGGSAYQGPLDVKTQNGEQAQLNGVNASGIVLANQTANPLNVRITNVATDSDLPLAYVLRGVTDTNVVSATFDLPSVYNAPVFDANEKRGFWLTLRPEKMTADTATTLLKISTDLGTECWLPVTGNRSQLNPTN